MTGSRPSVLIADDHAPTRRLVAEVLERSGEFYVCAEAADAEDCVEMAMRERPDICIIDINMPGGGISAASRISCHVPDAAIVMLTVSRDDQDLFDALRAGASGYVLKGLDDEELLTSLRRVMSGEASLPNTLVTRLVQEFRDRKHRRIPIGKGRGARLTSREWDVLELMHAGLTTSDIAARLYVSPVTVRSHVSSILRKLRVTSRHEALELFENMTG